MRRRGMTLVEVTISAAILAGILVLLATMLSTSASTTKFDLARNEAMASARKITQQLSRELSASGGHQGGSDHIDPTRATGGANLETITFAMRTGLSGTEAADWGTPITYRLVNDASETPGDGDDDDRDGVWDERKLERVQDGQTVVLDESVTVFRIDRAAGSDMLTITVEVARGGAKPHGLVTGPQDWVRVRMVTNVYVRNRNA